jgi:hypothetical protein
VKSLLADFVAFLRSKETWICNALIIIRIDLIAFAAALYIIVRIIKKILVSIVAGVFSSENKFIQVLNKLLGIILFAVMFVAIGLIVLQILALLDSQNGNLYQSLLGSGLNLDKLFINNPLANLIKNIKL